MLILYFVFSSALPVCCVSAAAEISLPSGEKAEDTEKIISSFFEKHKQTNAGLAVSVFTADEEIYTGYFGLADFAEKSAVDENTVFEWGDISAMTVWVSVMQLAEQGKLSLDEDIRTYLPKGFLKKLQYDKPVTMMNLMDHNAGFEDALFGVQTKDPDRIISLGESLEKYQPLQVYEPGTVVSYSSWGAALAGYIVELVSGKPFYEYAAENIFRPLGMDKTAIKPDLGDNEYVKRKRRELQCFTAEAQLIPDSRSFINLYPAGMCTSTAGDLMRFARELLKGEKCSLFEKETTAAKFFYPTLMLGKTELSRCCHGMWCFPEFNVNVTGHTGNTDGCSASMYLDADSGTGMVVMTNQSGETVYDQELPEKIFGKNKNIPVAEITGYVADPCTFYSGPLRIMRAFTVSSVTPEVLEGLPCAEYSDGGVRKLAMTYGDLLILSEEDAMMLLLPFLFWIMSAVCCVACIIFKSVRSLYRLAVRSPAKTKFGWWSTTSCLLCILLMALSLPLFSGMMPSEDTSAMRIWSVCCFVLLIAIIAVLIAGVVLTVIKRPKLQVIILNIAYMLPLIIAAGNIIFWQLCMFWLL